MNKYQEAKTNIVNTLVRIVGYPTYKKQFERDLEVLGELEKKYEKLEKALDKAIRTINVLGCMYMHTNEDKKECWKEYLFKEVQEDEKER